MSVPPSINSNFLALEYDVHIDDVMFVCAIVGMITHTENRWLDDHTYTAAAISIYCRRANCNEAKIARVFAHVIGDLKRVLETV